MNARSSFALVLPLIFLALPSADAFEDACSALKDALWAKDAGKRAPALEKLLALNDPRTLGTLHGYLIETIPALKDKERRLESLESERERRTLQIERRKKNAKDDAEKAAATTAEADFQKWLERDFEPAKKDTENVRGRREFLGKAAADLVTGLSAEKRLAEVQRLAKLVNDAKSTPAQREAAMECYARFGDKDSVTTLLRVGREAQKERKRMAEELPKREADYEKVKEVFHRERKQLGGNKITIATEAQMKKAQAEMDEFQKSFGAVTELEDAAFRLLPTALNSLSPEQKQKAVADVLALAKSADVSIRTSAIQALGFVNDPAVLSFLRQTVLAPGSEAGTRVACIDALASLKDESSLDAILDKCLKDPEWSVRASAIAALRSIRSAKAVPALLAAAENEVGRLRDDALATLRNLTGKDPGTISSWKAWWEKAKNEGFQPVPETEATKVKRAEDDGGTRVSFAGIPTSSRNVLFVVDVSGSMRFSLDAEQEAGAGQSSRLAVLKRELKAALERFPEGGTFGIVTFSSFVTRWTPKLEKMTPDMRKKALDFAANIEPEGSTNIYGALKEAFDMAGRGTQDKFYRPVVDVIYFLTDGKPSQDSEVSDTERILSAVRDWNKLGKVAIHVIALGEADLQFLRKLASQNHGEFSNP